MFIYLFYLILADIALNNPHITDTPYLKKNLTVHSCQCKFSQINSCLEKKLMFNSQYTLTNFTLAANCYARQFVRIIFSTLFTMFHFLDPKTFLNVNSFRSNQLLLFILQLISAIYYFTRSMRLSRLELNYYQMKTAPES